MFRNQQASLKTELSSTARVGIALDPDSTKFEEEFGGFLIAENIVDHIVLERATSAARKTGDRLDRVLTKLGLVSEANLAVALSKFLCLEVARPGELPLERLLPDLIEAD